MLTAWGNFFEPCDATGITVSVELPMGDQYEVTGPGVMGRMELDSETTPVPSYYRDTDC